MSDATIGTMPKVYEGANPESPVDRAFTPAQLRSIERLVEAAAKVLIDPDSGKKHVAAIVELTIALKATMPDRMFYDLVFEPLRRERI